jgi:predicted metal-dependent HD superfamily phosphohydrolase
MSGRYTDAWAHAWRALGGCRTDAALLDRLIACYGEPHRQYHSMQHLDECFQRFAELRDLAEHPAEIEIALWFHDAIYEVKSHDNEQRSAQWAREAALSAGAANDAADRIHALVMATRHQALPQTSDEQILVDVDLSILGADADRFDEYERQVRAEYAWVPGFVFRRKRREILGEFLARPRIYGTARFAASLETRARDNLRRSIALLGG